eukprot:6198048-Pleurochrysis_carterae.AAC.2
MLVRAISTAQPASNGQLTAAKISASLSKFEPKVSHFLLNFFVNQAPCDRVNGFYFTYVKKRQPSVPTQSISQLELLAAIAVYYLLPKTCKGRKVIHHVDSTSAVAGLVKGYSSSDSAKTVHTFWALACDLDTSCAETSILLPPTESWDSIGQAISRGLCVSLVSRKQQKKCKQRKRKLLALASADP